MYVDGRGESPIPYINGNAIRGKLRRLLMLDFFLRLGIAPEELPPKLYHTFFTGGALESSDAASGIIDLEIRKKIKALFPVISLLGCALENQMIPGKLKIGHAFPVCLEYAPYLPNNLKEDERAKISVKTFTDESFNTRKDDLRAEREEDEQAVQMKIEFECFIPGTKFYHWMATEYVNDLEASCFGRFIEIFREAPFLGGKLSSGNGEVTFNYHSEFPGSGVYLEFLRNEKNAIIDLIETLRGRK